MFKVYSETGSPNDRTCVTIYDEPRSPSERACLRERERESERVSERERETEIYIYICRYMMNRDRQVRGAKIYDELGSSNDGTSSRHDEPASPNEGSCLRSMLAK